jgi:diguanylate cyclase (GGDEF)-like protein
VILHPKILIIAADDDRVQTTESLFRETGYETLIVPDVLSAMAVLKAETIDVVLLEHNPSELVITDAVRIVKCLQHTAYMPVVCLFADAIDPQLKADVLDAGADDLLVGPVDPVEIQARVRRLMSTRTLHQEFLNSKTQLEDALSRESQLLRQLRNDNRQLRRRSITDGLTSLYNHRYLMEWLKTEFKIARRYGHPISFVMADLDHFKQVNDQYGHPFGDFVLKEVAVIAHKSARESDLVARYGGEEFAMVLPRTDPEMAHVFAKRFNQAIARQAFKHSGHSVQTTVSLGIATYPHDAEITSPEMLVYLADQALLEAKSSGRDRIVAWDSIDIEQRAIIRRQLKGDNCPIGPTCPVHSPAEEAAPKI